MTKRTVVLVDESGNVPMSRLEVVASALQKQVQNDFADVWNVTATVTAVASAAEIPAAAWPIFIKSDLDVADVYGYHWVDEKNRPYAWVKFRNGWSLTASHELLEMLVNPFLDKYQVTDISAEIAGDERFLVEVAGPVQSPNFAYYIDGVQVSNFFYPSYFDLLVVTGKQYDHLGVITKPRSILEGGYVSFVDNLGQWWQAFVIQNKVDLRRLFGGEADKGNTPGRILRGVVMGVSSAIIFYLVLNYYKKHGIRSNSKQR